MKIKNMSLVLLVAVFGCSKKQPTVQDAFEARRAELVTKITVLENTQDDIGRQPAFATATESLPTDIVYNGENENTIISDIHNLKRLHDPQVVNVTFGPLMGVTEIVRAIKMGTMPYDSGLWPKQINEFLSKKYLIVIKVLSYAKPSLNNDIKTYTPGSVDAEAFVYILLPQPRLLSRFVFAAKNSADIITNKHQLDRGIDNDLSSNAAVALFDGLKKLMP